jgi:photosystem II cytochrome c550
VNQKRQGKRTMWINRMLRVIIVSLVLLLGLGGAIAPSAYAVTDPYVAQYLKVLPGQQAELADGHGGTKAFGYSELLAGKDRFGSTCLSCHVGGSTIASPELALSLDNLKAMATPRDSIAALMDYMRSPVMADGSEESYSCRKVDASWINDPDLEQVAAFVLRAAETAPGWGTARF